MAIFGGLMTFFYLAVGLYIAFSNNLSHIEPFIRYLIGFTFMVYGIYRALRTYSKIKEVFFDKNNDE